MSSRRLLTPFDDRKTIQLIFLFQFRSLVMNVEKVGDNWKVTYMKTDTKQNVSEECGFVVVANGEFTAPHVPYFEKQEDFKGILKFDHKLDSLDRSKFWHI